MHSGGARRVLTMMSAFRLALLLGAAGSGPHAQSPVALAPGRWPVGFTHLEAADSSRPLQSGQPRPLDIGVWYPARASAAPHLTYRTYFLLSPPRQDSLPAAEAARRELDGFAGFLASHGAPAAAVTAWLDAPMLATPDPPAAGARFPVVLVAQGNEQSLHDQAPLCEYLASHGYVVATAPSPMRISGPLTDEHDVGARAAEQAQDLAVVLARLAPRGDVDARRVGVVGHSFGARAALLFGMAEPRVAALVSLDGGIGTATARTNLEQVPSFHPSALRAPVLHFYERLDAFMAPDLRFTASCWRPAATNCSSTWAGSSPPSCAPSSPTRRAAPARTRVPRGGTGRSSRRSRPTTRMRPSRPSSA